jgi:hypothetical protein
MAEKFLSFSPKHKSLEAILTDHKLASLGDAYVNFVYSIALSKRKGEAAGTKVNSRILSQALKKAKLKEFTPKRSDRHKLADAAEALIVYAWIQGAISIEESITMLSSSENTIAAFTDLLLLAKDRLKL